METTAVFNTIITSNNSSDTVHDIALSMKGYQTTNTRMIFSVFATNRRVLKFGKIVVTDTKCVSLFDPVPDCVKAIIIDELVLGDDVKIVNLCESHRPRSLTINKLTFSNRDVKFKCSGNIKLSINPNVYVMRVHGRNHRLLINADEAHLPNGYDTVISNRDFAFVDLSRMTPDDSLTIDNVKTLITVNSTSDKTYLDRLSISNVHIWYDLISDIVAHTFKVSNLNITNIPLNSAKAILDHYDVVQVFKIREIINSSELIIL